MGAFGNHEVIEEYETAFQKSNLFWLGVFILWVVRVTLFALAGMTVYTQQLSYSIIILLAILAINTSFSTRR
jgi:hypothetical protein